MQDKRRRTQGARLKEKGERGKQISVGSGMAKSSAERERR